MHSAARGSMWHFPEGKDGGQRRQVIHLNSIFRTMPHFTPAFLHFFRDLEKHNDREWFAAHKGLYESEVKQPFERFVGELIRELAKEDKNMAIAPKDAIFRIFRDTRFSKDKTPYKLHASAAISPGGRKAMAEPGLYVELSARHVGLAGGVYMPDKSQVEDIRAAMAYEPKKWKKAISDPEFRKLWGGLQGEKNKILPVPYRELAAELPEIAHKQFYYWVELPAGLVTSDRLISEIMRHHRAAEPVRNFLRSALN